MQEYYLAACNNCVFLAKYDSSRPLYRYCMLRETLIHIACCCEWYMPKRRNRRRKYYINVFNVFNA